MTHLSAVLCCSLLAIHAIGCSRPAPAPGPELFDTSNLQSLEILRLRPYGEEGTLDISTEPAPDRFRGWRVIDRVTVDRPSTQSEISQLVERGLREGEEGNLAASCFEPRHAIIARSPNSTCELEICFACSWVYVYQDGKSSRRMISDAPMELLEELLGPAEVTRREPVE
ncbi:hypothetical protein [Aeoliella sp. SH292]|uniref:hypothetical protein n=1 Tax=Aeoliella sp. SH292 TaxID=3454464 RepID=UPI003F9AFFDB